jgi:hypothetical protein
MFPQETQNPIRNQGYEKDVKEDKQKNREEENNRGPQPDKWNQESTEFRDVTARCHIRYQPTISHDPPNLTKSQLIEILKQDNIQITKHTTENTTEHQSTTLHTLLDIHTITTNDFYQLQLRDPNMVIYTNNGTPEDWPEDIHDNLRLLHTTTGKLLGYRQHNKSHWTLYLPDFILRYIIYRAAAAHPRETSGSTPPESPEYFTRYSTTENHAITNQLDRPAIQKEAQILIKTVANDLKTLIQQNHSLAQVRHEQEEKHPTQPNEMEQ